MSAPDLNSYDGWLHNTGTIRQWLSGERVSAGALEAQLRRWLSHLVADFRITVVAPAEPKTHRCEKCGIEWPRA